VSHDANLHFQTTGGAHTKGIALCVNTQYNYAFFGGLRNRSSFGPNSTRPAQIWPYACVPDPNCSEPSREGRASVCNRAVERRRPRDSFICG
jgi:hypothetical protein